MEYKYRKNYSRKWNIYLAQNLIGYAYRIEIVNIFGIYRLHIDCYSTW